MSERLTITVPGTPSKKLSPNAARRTHYHEKSDISAELRDRAMLAALAVRPHGRVPMLSGDVVLEITVYWGKGERRVDLSAIPAMCKPLEDGLTDAGIWRDDSQVRRLIVEQFRDPDKVGKVEMTVTDWTAYLLNTDEDWVMEQAAPGVGTAAERGGR